MATFWGVVLVALGASMAAAKQQCYGDLGCFETTPAFQALPQSPDHVATAFQLYTRSSTKHPAVLTATDRNSWQNQLNSGHFDSHKPTKVVIHGFSDSALTEWVVQMKDALLHKGDYNVIVVDWPKGAVFPYTQASANAFLVGAELAKLLEFLHATMHVNLQDVHLIGHSLGAQISGIAGAQARTVGRISGLDPAEPYFEDFDASKHLDKSDAAFVDVIHTDAEKFVGIAGYGTMTPLGHIDFYPNGGLKQPGCTDDPIGGLLGGLLHGHITDGIHAVSCSHSRSTRLYIESLTGSGSCKFTAYSCHNFDDYEAGKCHGCPSGGCPIMGFDADKSSARGSFYLSTTAASPFCGFEYFVEIDLSGHMSETAGKLYITLMGTKGFTHEIEFSKDVRRYHENDKEVHMVAGDRDVGDITSVRVRFERGHGISVAGTAKEIVIHAVTVVNQLTGHRSQFCAGDDHVTDGNSDIVTKQAGC